MKRHWSMPNMLAMCDTCLGELMKDMEEGRITSAMEKAERMRKNIAKLKAHCAQCDERVIDEI